MVGAEAKVRVNVEDDVKKHLPRLAAEMGWTQREALGCLVLVWGATQDALIYEDTPERVATVCALCFDSDSQAQRFITAMIGAQLAMVLDDGRVRIRGNKEHIERLEGYRIRATKGGRAKAVLQAAKTTVSSASSMLQAAKSDVSASYSLPSFAPLLPCSSSPKDLQPSSALTAAKPKAKKPKTPTETHRIRTAWEANYESKHGIAYLNWDGAHAKFAKSLEDKADSVIALMPAYFALNVAHTFYEGFDSFKAHLNKLNARHTGVARLPSFEDQMRETAERAAREEQA